MFSNSSNSTHKPSSDKPQLTLNGEDYFTRKGNYAVKGLIICDDTTKKTWVVMGWPGSVHDNWVWLNSDVYLSKEKYSTTRQQGISAW